MNLTVISSAFFVLMALAAVVFIWVEKPNLPRGSGKNTTWVSYSANHREWVGLAVIFSFCAVLFLLMSLHSLLVSL